MRCTRPIVDVAKEQEKARAAGHALSGLKHVEQIEQQDDRQRNADEPKKKSAHAPLRGWCSGDERMGRGQVPVQGWGRAAPAPLSFTP